MIKERQPALLHVTRPALIVPQEPHLRRGQFSNFGIIVAHQLARREAEFVRHGVKIFPVEPVRARQDATDPRVIMTNRSGEFSRGHPNLIQSPADPFPNPDLHVLPWRHTSRYHGFGRVATAKRRHWDELRKSCSTSEIA